MYYRFIIAHTHTNTHAHTVSGKKRSTNNSKFNICYGTIGEHFNPDIKEIQGTDIHIHSSPSFASLYCIIATSTCIYYIPTCTSIVIILSIMSRGCIDIIFMVGMCLLMMTVARYYCYCYRRTCWIVSNVA